MYACLPLSLSEPSTHDDDDALSTRQKVANLDYAGAILLTSSIILFLWALADGSFHPVLLTLCVIAVLSFVLVEFRFASDPIIPLTILSSRGVLLSCFAQTGIMSARWLVLFFVPLTALAVRGLSTSTVGALLIPTNIGFGVGGVLAGWLHIRAATSYWSSCVLTVLLAAGTLLALSPLSSGVGSLPLLIATITLNGIVEGASVSYTANHALFHAVPSAQIVTSSLMTTFRAFGGSVGMALGGSVFSGTLRAALTDAFLRLDDGCLSIEHARLVERLMGSQTLVWSSELDSTEHTVALAGYQEAARNVFLAAAVIAAASAVIQAGTGWRSKAAVACQVDEEEDG